VAAHGLAGEVHPCEATADAARELVARLLAERPGLTGVLVHNEPIVGTVVQALRAAGRRVPEDVSVVALCPDEMAEHAEPPLSSVAIPADEVGGRAVDLLMAKLVGGAVPAATLLPPTLTRRASSAAAVH
jgi:DNA-binding LacI/PurR family transcriptional regulator